MITVGLRLKLIALGGTVLAVWLGSMIAQEDYATPFLIASLAVFGTLTFLFRAPVSTLALGIAARYHEHP